MAVTHQSPSCAFDQMKATFRDWDCDGRGFISRRSLMELLVQLAGRQLSERELNTVMREADKNGNGVIEYDEFIDWVKSPVTAVTMSPQGLARFDFNSVLLPLWQVYDQNGDGRLSMEEFMECHTILKNSLGLSSKSGSTTRPSLLLSDYPANIFQEVDRDRNSVVSFEEFADWQKEQLATSGHSSSELEELISALARQLKRVFSFSEKRELSDCDGRVLQRIVDNVASFSTELWHSKEQLCTTRALQEKKKQQKHYTNRWSEPPAGLGVRKLKSRFLATEVRTKRKSKDRLDLDVLVLPARLDSSEDINTISRRQWVAQVILTVTAPDGRSRVEEPLYYNFEDLRWVKSAEAEHVFQDAFDSMPPELKIFCILKSEANFGIRLPWPDLRHAFERCIGFGLLDKEHVDEYNRVMELRVLKSLREEGLDTQGSQTQERLLESIEQMPREVMAILSDMEVVKVSSVWADFMNS